MKRVGRSVWPPATWAAPQRRGTHRSHRERRLRSEAIRAPRGSSSAFSMPVRHPPPIWGRVARDVSAAREVDRGRGGGRAAAARMEEGRAAAARMEEGRAAHFPALRARSLALPLLAATLLAFAAASCRPLRALFSRDIGGTYVGATVATITPTGVHAGAQPFEERAVTTLDVDEADPREIQLNFTTDGRRVPCTFHVGRGPAPLHVLATQCSDALPDGTVVVQNITGGTVRPSGLSIVVEIEADFAMSERGRMARSGHQSIRFTGRRQ